MFWKKNKNTHEEFMNLARGMIDKLDQTGLGLLDARLSGLEDAAIIAESYTIANHHGCIIAGIIRDFAEKYEEEQKQLRDSLPGLPKSD